MAATIFAANESSVQVNGTALEGVRSVEYRFHQARTNVYALGSAERIGMISGAQSVEGRIRVASTASALDGLMGDVSFDVLAILRHGETALEVAFQECYLTEKSFDMSVGAHGEAIYTFTAARVVEAPGG
jgi:hypothetical protein